MILCSSMFIFSLFGAGTHVTCLMFCRPYGTMWRLQTCHPHAGLRVGLGSMAASFLRWRLCAGTYVACLCYVVPTGLGGGSSHVIPTLVCALVWDLWLRHFFVDVLCAGDESACLISYVPTGLGFLPPSRPSVLSKRSLMAFACDG